MPLCLSCRNELKGVGESCARCGIPLLGGNMVCGECLENPPPFSRTVAALRYVSPAKELIHQLKFRQNIPVAQLLGSVLGARLASEADGYPQLLIPVPLSRRRLRERGFNQAVEIGRVVAREVHVPMRVDICQRVRHTVPQVQLDGAAARKRNIRGAFAVTRTVHGLHLAILDDVMTTGATAAELARTLIRGGARRVDLWACCRSVPT